MKVKVAFDETTVVVPCGNGEDEVRALFDKAAHRYKKATGKGDGVAVEITALHTAADNAVVDPDDIISDVLDDKEVLIAMFTLYGDDDVCGGRSGNGGGVAAAAGTGARSSGSSSVPSSSAASTPSPFPPSSCSPSPLGDRARAPTGSPGTMQQHSADEYSSVRGTLVASGVIRPGVDRPSSPRKALSTRVPRPEPPAAHAPMTLPDDPEQSFAVSQAPAAGHRHSVDVLTPSAGAAQTKAVSRVVSPARRASSPSRSPLMRSVSPRRQAPVSRSPIAERSRRMRKPSASNSELEQDEEEDEFGTALPASSSAAAVPPMRFHRNTVLPAASALGGTRSAAAASGSAPGPVRGSVTHQSTMMPSRFLVNRWEKQEQLQWQQLSEQRLRDAHSVSAVSAQPEQPSSSSPLATMAAPASQHHYPDGQWPSQPDDHENPQRPPLPRQQTAAAAQSRTHPRLDETEQLDRTEEQYEQQPEQTHTPKPRSRIPTGQEVADIELSCRSSKDEAGVFVRGYRTSDDRDIGVFVHDILPGSVAAENGLIRIADRLICVNGIDLTELSNNQAVALFQDAVRKGNMKLQVSRALGSFDDTANSPSPSPPPTQAAEATTAPATTTSQSQTATSSTTSLQQRSHHASEHANEDVFERPPGSVSMTTLKSQTSNVAVATQESAAAIEQVQQRGVLPATNTLPSTAARRVGRRQEIVLEKGASGGLGFSVTSRDVAVGNDQDRPVFIKVVTPGGLAFRDGRLRANDRLLEVNGTSLTGLTQKEAVQVLKNTSGKVSLILWREEAIVDDETQSRSTSQTSMTPVTEHKAIEATTQTPPSSPGKDSKPAPPSGQAKSENRQQPESRALAASSGVGVVQTPLSVRKQLLFTIPLTSSGSAGLGISVKGKTAMSSEQRTAGEQGDVGHGIYIKNVLPGGAAAKDGRLQPSDRLVSINGENLSSLSDYEAFESLRKCMAGASQRPSIDLVIERRSSGIVGSRSPNVMTRATTEKKASTASASSQDHGTSVSGGGVRESNAASAATAAAALGSSSSSSSRPVATVAAAAGGVSGVRAASATGTSTAMTTASSGAPRERSIEGEIAMTRPKEPPSAIARQQAQHLQQQQQQLAAATVSPSLGSSSHFASAPASKKNSSSELNTDSGVVDTTTAYTTAASTHASEVDADRAAINASNSATGQGSQRSNKADVFAGRGYQTHSSLLETLRNRNAASTAGGGTADDTNDSPQSYTPGSNRRGDAAQAAKSPAAVKKSGWRSAHSKSSSALLQNVSVPGNADTATQSGDAVRPPSSTPLASAGAVSSATPTSSSLAAAAPATPAAAAAAMPAQSRNAGSGKTQTLVEMVSGGSVTGKGTRIVPATAASASSSSTSPHDEAPGGRIVSPGPSEPTKVSVRAMQVDPPSKVIIRQVETPIFTKSPTQDHARPLDSRPDSAPPISRHTIFVSGSGGGGGGVPGSTNKKSKSNRYTVAEGHDYAGVDLSDGSPQVGPPGSTNDSSPSVVLRNAASAGGGKGMSPAGVRRNHAMSVAAAAPHKQQQRQYGSSDEGEYEEEVERHVHYDKKLRNSELPVDVNDWSRLEYGKYPHNYVTLPRKFSKKHRKQRPALPQVDGPDNSADPLAGAEQLTGSEARTRGTIWLPDNGELELDEPYQVRYDENGDPLPEREDEQNASGELEEDTLPPLSRSGPGRKSMSERGHTSLNARNSEFFIQLKERKKAGKGGSVTDDGDILEQAMEESGHRRLSVSSIHSGGVRRAASLESLQQVLGSGPDVTITDNISNSPKARRLLGIQSEGSGAQSNGNVKPPFQRRQSYDKGVTSPESAEGLGAELVRRPGSSSTIQFGSKPSYSSKKPKKIFNLSFLKGIGKHQGKRPRGMPAPLPMLEPVNRAASRDSSSLGSPESADNASVSSQSINAATDGGAASHPDLTVSPPPQPHHLTTRTDSDVATTTTTALSSSVANGRPKISGDEWSAADGRYDDEDGTHQAPMISSCHSEIQLREGVSLDHLRDATTRSESARDVRLSASHDNLSSPMSPLLVEPPVLVVKDTI
ncbi:uncharacterized protein LOC135827538 isoform X2 [Sycon ciliatum]|uniref:uncharacterized protein LOC135827538 isoform X2 n=1 Tax=Sycon ciliatum TaxID=27933 RepID=UPI0031F64A4C